MGAFGQTLFPTTTAAHRVLPSVWGLGQQMVTTVSALLGKRDPFLKPGNQNAGPAMSASLLVPQQRTLAPEVLV